MSLRQDVITSYSIHYTKLYEDGEKMLFMGLDQVKHLTRRTIV